MDQFYILSFILNVRPLILPAVKKQLVQGLQKMDVNDRALMYRPGHVVVPKGQGQTVADIANYIHSDKFVFKTALRNTIQIAGNEDEDFFKLIFIILDRFQEKDSYGLQQPLQFDLDFDVKCNFKVCMIGSKYDAVIEDICDAHPRCDLIKLDNLESLGDYILSQYESK